MLNNNNGWTDRRTEQENLVTSTFVPIPKHYIIRTRSVSTSYFFQRVSFDSNWVVILQRVILNILIE